jgi:hypothetical protein
MKMNKEHNRKQFMVPFNSSIRAMLLVEIARSRGMDSWIEVGNRIEVIICGDKDRVTSAVETARDCDGLLHLRQLEALALTIRDIGETPSETLMEAIDVAKRGASSEKKGGGPTHRLHQDNLRGLN